MKTIIRNFIFIAITVLIALACGSTKEVDPRAILTGSTWELSAINGNPANPSAFSRGLPYVTFTADNKMMGKGGCNRFSGPYNLNTEGGINMGPLTSTKMACEGVNENEFFAALEKAKIAKIDTGKLTLLNGVTEVLVFVPRNKDQQ
ncbi:hypothetical protein CHU92_08560 [Flavobacterium cyanobacteriorum]|uniref:DUF306 domain-containing protein n=1 Tax=Flavobacterium cyanobacteriorum TaxID=2022802 RepID=A0A255Z6S2_9FLAO|nr:META domain-containing protein [Flavobacterium cyanobacteriorum]OYQ37233.1 hypothetical protein CHU92_08560 [Flavobacterium cyanobacteriorum]